MSQRKNTKGVYKYIKIILKRDRILKKKYKKILNTVWYWRNFNPKFALEKILRVYEKYEEKYWGEPESYSKAL